MVVYSPASTVSDGTASVCCYVIWASRCDLGLSFTLPGERARRTSVRRSLTLFAQPLFQGRIHGPFVSQSTIPD